MEYMTPKEAATILKVSPQTITRWAKQGKFSYFQTQGGERGSMMRVNRSSFLAFVRNHTKPEQSHRRTNEYEEPQRSEVGSDAPQNPDSV